MSILLNLLLQQHADVRRPVAAAAPELEYCSSTSGRQTTAVFFPFSSCELGRAFPFP